MIFRKRLSTIKLFGFEYSFYNLKGVEKVSYDSSLSKVFESLPNRNGTLQPSILESHSLAGEVVETFSRLKSGKDLHERMNDANQVRSDVNNGEGHDDSRINC